MAIARYPSTVLDCPDPSALARFYAAVLDWQVTEERPGWAEARADYGQCLCFQGVEGYVAPRWPDQDVPQQVHLDLVVDDLEAGESAVVALGATRTDLQPGERFRVFLDPVGHPFCLVLDQSSVAPEGVASEGAPS